MFEIVSDEQQGEHRFIRIVPKAPDSLAADLAPRITRPYFDEETARDRIIRAARELEIFSGEELDADDPRIEAVVAEERDAVLPAAWKGDRPKQLDVQRSEFGEIVAAEVLSSLFETRIPTSRIAHKETPDQQTRGADVMGIEGDEPQLLLILTEVKGSTDSKTPPGVIPDMEAKLKGLVENRRALLQELIWLRDHSSEAHTRECATICVSFQLRQPIFGLLLAPILIRTASKEGASDAGGFRESPETFGCPIRFVSVIVEPDLFELAGETYALARRKAA
ncbi:MAG TPA: Hachiman antiphage defense system protein HamA [Solirubrobacterales bacterium]|nr:Hachiman antiphage defense system protein HamA [Solirubrobacterales bacterium]